MGGNIGYCRPVNPTGLSTWTAHTNRGVPSTEPGTDYYCRIGTGIRAASSGVVVDVGDSIMPATGRYVTIDLDDGRRVRYLHLLNRLVGVGDRVQWGQHIANSGASGYGEADWSWNVAETGGAHVHMTLWARQAYTFGRYATLDPELYMADQEIDTSPILSEEDDMQSIRVDKTHLYGVAPQYVTHYGDITQATLTRQVTSATDELHELTSAQFNALLDGLGIPRTVVSNGAVFNPESGVHEKNGTWSREREILAALAKR